MNINPLGRDLLPLGLPFNSNIQRVKSVKLYSPLYFYNRFLIVLYFGAQCLAPLKGCAIYSRRVWQERRWYRRSSYSPSVVYARVQCASRGEIILRSDKTWTVWSVGVCCDTRLLSINVYTFTGGLTCRFSWTLRPHLNGVGYN